MVNVYVLIGLMSIITVAKWNYQCRSFECVFKYLGISFFYKMCTYSYYHVLYV